MSNTQLKIDYLINSLTKKILSVGDECPSCGANHAKILERKFLVTDLRRCDKCKLLYRTPTTTSQENFSFYQKTYRQGLTTDLPTNSRLQEWKENNFVGCPKNYDRYIYLLKLLKIESGAKILDYGCSWGYGSFQLGTNGYDVTGFEISQPRCNYAKEKLGVNATSSLEQIQDKFDIIFSSHVIEHLPSVSQYLEWANKHLVNGGYLVTICPNGSDEFRSSSPASYSKLWGFYHPQMLDEQFYTNYFGGSSLLLSCRLDDPQIETWDRKALLCSSLDKSELLCIWFKH